MKRSWKIIAVALCAATLLTGAFAAATAGGEGDPLVTLSYLKNVFTGQVRTMVNEAVAAGQSQNKADFDKAVADWDAKIGQAIEQALKTPPAEEPATFSELTVAEGKAMTFKTGCEIVVRSGAPVSSVGLIDQTDGTTLAAGKPLVANHLYLATADGKLSAPAVTVTGVVNAGPLNVRAGGGSSYSILGTLQEGTVVTIVDDSVSGWYMVTGGGLAGYVSAQYITLNPVAASGPAALLLRGSFAAE